MKKLTMLQLRYNQPTINGYFQKVVNDIIDVVEKQWVTLDAISSEPSSDGQLLKLEQSIAALGSTVDALKIEINSLATQPIMIEEEEYVPVESFEKEIKRLEGILSRKSDKTVRNKKPVKKK